MTEPTERDRIDLALVYVFGVNADLAMHSMLDRFEAAAREEGRRETLAECAKIADDCIYMVGRQQAAAIAAKIRSVK